MQGFLEAVVTSSENSFQRLALPIQTEERTSENDMAVGFFFRGQESIHVRPE